MRLPQYVRKIICREMRASRALRARASRAGHVEGGILRGFALAPPLRVLLQAPPGNGGKPHPAGQAIARRGVSASVRSYGPRLRYGKARKRLGGVEWRYLQGLERGRGGCREAGGGSRQRGAWGGSGERRSRRKVNARRGAQPPENCRTGRLYPSNMANKLL